VKEVSEAWGRTITGSFTPYVRATVLADFQTGTEPYGIRVPIVDGSVDLDADADVYGTGKLTVPGSYWPDAHGDALIAPYGPEVYLQAGLLYRDDLVELLGLGYFRIKVIGQKGATTSGEIDMSLSDRWAGLARATLLAPAQFSAAITNGDFVEALVGEVYPDGSIEWDDATVRDTPLGRDVIVEDDRAAAVKSCIVSVGKVARFDHRGILVINTPTNPLDAQIAARLTSGRDGVLSDVSRELTDEGVVNVVVAKGDGADEVGAAYGVAFDLDPNSPTRYGGPFGPSPKYVTSSLITSDDIAVVAANAELSRSQGLPHTLSFEISPRYDLEPDDLTHIEHAYGVGRHLIASLSIPLIAGRTMTGVTRQQFVSFRGDQR
jgi:hypothetical protein